MREILEQIREMKRKVIELECKIIEQFPEDYGMYSCHELTINPAKLDRKLRIRTLDGGFERIEFLNDHGYEAVLGTFVSDTHVYVRTDHGGYVMVYDRETQVIVDPTMREPS